MVCHGKRLVDAPSVVRDVISGSGVSLTPLTAIGNPDMLPPEQRLRATLA